MTTTVVLICLSAFIAGVFAGVMVEYHARKSFLREQHEREATRRRDK